MKHSLIYILNSKYRLQLRLDMDNEYVLNYCLDTHGVDGYTIYNLYVCIKYRTEFIVNKEINKYDTFYLKHLNEKDKLFKIIENYSIIISSFLNEMITKEIYLKPNEYRWLSINLSNLYKTDVLKYLDNYISKDEISDKIINTSVIISTLLKDRNIYLYNPKNSKLCPNDIYNIVKNNIKTSNGLKIILHPNVVGDLSILRYNRKPYLIKPNFYEFRGKNIVKDIIDNDKYNIKPWIKDYESLEELDFLNTHVKESATEILNILSAIPLHINIENLEEIEKLATKWKIKGFRNLKFELLNIRYKLEDYENYNIKMNEIKSDIKFYEFDEIVKKKKNEHSLDIKKSLQTLGTTEIIKKQINDIINVFDNTFYLGYNMDERARIYSTSWPLSYQLNHTIRSLIKLDWTKNDEIMINLNKFFKLEFVKENILKYHKIEDLYIYTKRITKIEMNRLYDWLFYEIPEPRELYIECIIMNIDSIVPKNWKENRLIKGIELLDELNRDGISEFKEKYKYEDKDYYQLINLFNFTKNIKESIKMACDSIVWPDASNNSLQLFAYMNGIDDDKVLEILNVYSNDKGTSNIYDMITQSIDKKDHKEFLNSIENIITLEEFLKFNTKSDNKRRTMPMCYGKTLYANVKDDNIVYSNDERKDIWNKISYENKYEISKYYLKMNFDEIKGIGIDLNNYKNIVSKKERYWLNSYGIPIVINNKIVSKRGLLKDKIKTINGRIYHVEKANENYYKYKKKLVTKEEYINELNKLIIKYEKEMVIDEKKFDSRNRILINGEKITLRIPKNVKELDKDGIKSSLLPSSIHSYDSSIIMLCILICHYAGIETLPIHDSLGCKLIYLPLVRLIFIAANIKFHKQHSERGQYPHNDKIIRKPIPYKMFLSHNSFRVSI